MNGWQAIGAIFLCFAMILLIAGVANGLNTINALDQSMLGQYVSSQLKGTLFWRDSQLYLISSAITFVVGAISVYAGSISKVVADTPSQVDTVRIDLTPPTFTLNESNNVVLNKSKIVCGSCGTLNDIDAVYCKKCGGGLR
jgi:hypothetical protein